MAKDYNPIPGVGTGARSLQIGLRASLYDGPDHLLIVYTTGYTEEYKRVFYADIRYIVVQKTEGQIWQGVISAICIALIGLLYLFFAPLSQAGINFLDMPLFFIAALSTPFIIWFMVNLLRGPTCKCYVSTDIQTLKLPVPKRMNKVARLIAFLRTKTPALEQPAA